MPTPEYKTTIAILFKNGASVSTKSTLSRDEAWAAYSSAWPNDDMRIPVGDDKNNVAKVRVAEVIFISIQDFVDERAQAQRSGLIVPKNSIQ